MYSPEEIKRKAHEIQCFISAGELASAIIIADDLKFRCPEDCEAQEARAAVCIELLHFTEALQLLNSAIAKAPSIGFDKYLMRAELKDGQEAIQDFETAIEMIKRDIAENKDGESQPATWDAYDVVEDSLQRKLSRAYCSLATEHSVMAIESLDEGAEVPNVPEFQTAMEKAKEADPTYVECYTLMASYEIRKGDKQAAKHILESSRACWHPEECEEFVNFDRGIKITLAQVLSDVGLYEDAETVLVENLESNDQDRESSEMLAELYFERGAEGDMERAKIYCRQAIQSTKQEGAASSDADAAKLEEDYDRLMNLFAGINQELGLDHEDGLDEEDLDADEDDDDEIEKELMDQLCGGEDMDED